METTERPAVSAWRVAPLLQPTLGVAGGILLAAQARYLEVTALVALAGLSVALRRSTAARWLGWIAAGALCARLAWIDPERSRPAMDTARPVEAVATLVEHPRRGAFGWHARARLSNVRQDDRFDDAAREITLDLPASDPPRIGESVRARGYLAAGVDYANRVAAEGGPWRLRVKAASLMRLERPAGPLARVSSALRRRVERALESAGDGPGRAYAAALVLGDGSRLDTAWRRAMRRGGLAHLLAVSGFNVSLAAAIVLILAGWLPGRWRLLPTAFAVFFYLLLVGPMAPILRAAVMALMTLAAWSLRRPPRTANALAAATCVLLLARPSWIADVGFQLTVAATAGLVFLAPRFDAAWSGAPRWLRRPLAASAAAQLATLPIVLTAFHHASPVGLLANLVAVPWCALLLVTALAWCLLAVIAPALAAAAAPAIDLLAEPLTWLSSTPAAWWLVRPTAAGAVGACAFTSVVGFALLRPRRLAWVVALVAAGLRCAPSPADAGPRAVFLDVGQGDAILLRDGRHAVLVDGGGWSEGDFGGRVLLPALAGEGVRRLDAVVLTHADRDHCGGLVDLVDYLEVDEIWTAPGLGAGCGRSLLLRPGPRVRVLWRGESAEAGAWRLRVLGPGAGERGSDNRRSLVLLASAGSARLLLTGDIDAGDEQRLLRGATDLRADVLKVAHHGSRSSTSQAFLGAVRPRLAVISAGRGNAFGHPHAEVVARLGRAGIAQLRTDLAGQIGISFASGGSLRVETPAAPR